MYFTVGLAYLLVLSVTDVTSLFLDFLSVPVPKTLFSIPWSTGFCIMVLLMLWPSIRVSRICPLDRWSVGALAILLFWLVLDAARWSFGGVFNPSLVISFVPPWLVFVSIRAYLKIFDSAEILIDSFIYTLWFISLLHIAFLLPILLGFHAPLMNPNEVIDRNGLSMLLVAGVLVAGILDDRVSEDIGRRWVFLSWFSLVHCLLNNARAAMIVLFLVLLMRYLVKSREVVSGHVGWVLVSCFLVILGVALSYPVLQFLSGFSWFGGGDSGLSTLYRSEANWLLLKALADSPLLGIGWDGVAQVRSGGYISHSLYVIVVAGYGLLGLLPVLYFFGLWLNAETLFQRYKKSIIILVLIISTSFINDPMPWFGFIMALVSVSRRKQFKMVAA